MDKRYRVVVNYDTGDSFSQSPDQECEVWDNDSELIAQENAKRIKAQQDFYEKDYEFTRSYSNRKKVAPLPTDPFIIKDEYGNWKILLLDDEREEHAVYCGTWQGYFEHFNYVEVQGRPYRL